MLIGTSKCKLQHKRMSYEERSDFFCSRYVKVVFVGTKLNCLIYIVKVISPYLTLKNFAPQNDGYHVFENLVLPNIVSPIALYGKNACYVVEFKWVQHKSSTAR